MADGIKTGRWAEVVGDSRQRALCRFAETLTGSPGSYSEFDLDPLRDAGLDDRAIHDLVMIVGYFNFVNRLALGLAVELEPQAG